jgi:hypothetical protein
LEQFSVIGMEETDEFEDQIRDEERKEKREEE